MCDVDAIHPLRETAERAPIEEDPVTVLGGKGANLVALCEAGFPVPDGFVVTTAGYRRFLRESGLRSGLSGIAEVDVDDPEAVAAAADRARAAILEADVPAELREAVRETYAGLGDGSERVAVRSSAAAEDGTEASFAGQQDTFLGVVGADAVVARIQECWASLYTERALVYRAERGAGDGDLDIAVVVQEMVDADASGVLFTVDPTTGAREMTVEAVLGLGEAVVSGAVSPDNYVIDRETREVVSETIKAQEVMYVPDEEAGTTVETEVPADRREGRVLDRETLDALVDVGERIERHYGTPQDVEWAIRDGEVFVLQARPITTIRGDRGRVEGGEDGDGLTVSGLGASGGTASGHVRLDPIEAVKRARDGEEVILVRERTSPSDVHGMRAARGIVTSAGGTTSHAAIVARELDKPAVVGCSGLSVDYDAGCVLVGSRRVEPGSRVRVDGDAGTVTFPEGG